jgi:AraC-like DNA-binding protein
MTGNRPEQARYWRHLGVPGVDLIHARYVTHRFCRHTHETYAIGLVRAGVEEWRHGGSLERAGAGAIPVVNPGTVHTGHAGVPEGWTYRMLYPSVALMTEIAAEVGLGPGTPWFRDPVLDAPDTARLLLSAHRTAEHGDALAASTLIRLFLAHALCRYAQVRLRKASIEQRPAGAAIAVRAREVLEARLAEPPGLEELAADLSTGPFALLRAFKRRYGLPPHAWLTQRRVDQACRLLGSGHASALVATTVGFVDQAHLSRHFRRIVGVPPGAYQRERAGRCHVGQATAD